MKLYNSIILEKSFNSVEERLKKLLKFYGYQIVYERSIGKSLKRRKDTNERKYKVIGVDPYFSYELTRIEEKAGILMPFNILLQEIDDKSMEIAIINAEFSLSTLGSARIFGIAAVINSEMDEILNSL